MEEQLKLGEILRKKREERNLTQDEVSEATFISSRYIKALEEEDWDKLPERAYALGYLRIYSRFLELDEKEMLSLFNRVYSAEPPDLKALDWKKGEETRFQGTRKEESERSTVFKKVLAVLISLTIFFALLFVFLIFRPVPEEEGMIVNPPVAAIEPEEIPPPSEEVVPQFSLTVTLFPERAAWAEIWSAGNEAFSGILVPDKKYVIKSNYPVEVWVRGGDGVRAVVNGEDRGYLSEGEEKTRQIFEP